MPTDFYIKLILAVYRVTELFPEGEPLKWQIRESANKILIDLITDNKPENISQEIKAIKNYFALAEAQNWLDSRNFFVLRREYDKIESLINTGKTVEKSFSRFNENHLNKRRQEKILEILKEKDRIQTKELIQRFPQISKRTLIRDLEELYRAGIVVRVGNGRASCYNIKS